MHTLMKQILPGLGFLSLISLSVVNGGCGGSGGVLGDSPTISGRIEAWSMGSGYTLQAEVSAAPTAQRILATATIDPGGNFAITLPGATVMNTYGAYQSTIVSGSVNCSGPVDGSISVNPNPIVGVQPRFYAVMGTTRRRVSLTAINAMQTTQTVSATQTSVSYYYSAVDASASGQVSCTVNTGMQQGTVRSSLGLSIAPGWNSVVADLRTDQTTGQPANSTVNLYSGSPPPQAQWILN